MPNHDPEHYLKKREDAQGCDLAHFLEIKPPLGHKYTPKNNNFSVINETFNVLFKNNVIGLIKFK